MFSGSGGGRLKTVWNDFFRRPVGAVSIKPGRENGGRFGRAFERKRDKENGQGRLKTVGTFSDGLAEGNGKTEPVSGVR